MSISKEQIIKYSGFKTVLTKSIIFAVFTFCITIVFMFVYMLYIGEEMFSVPILFAVSIIGIIWLFIGVTPVVKNILHYSDIMHGNYILKRYKVIDKKEHYNKTTLRWKWILYFEDDIWLDVSLRSEMYNGCEVGDVVYIVYIKNKLFCLVNEKELINDKGI